MARRRQKQAEQKMINLMEGEPLNINITDDNYSKSRIEDLDVTDDNHFKLRENNVVKVSDMIDTLSHFNPDADIHNISDGRYVITSPSGLVTDVDIHNPNVSSTLFEEAMDSVLEDEDQCCGDCNCNCNCDDNQKYGDRTSKVMNLANMYNSGDFAKDTIDMDTDFAAFVAQLQIATSNAVNDRIANTVQLIQEDMVDISKTMIDNLVSYQNTKNARTEMELAVRRVK